MKYREVYEKSKAQINIDPEAHEIRAAKEAYKNISNVRASRFTFHLQIPQNIDQVFVLCLARLQEEV